MPFQTSTNNYQISKYIVDKNGDNSCYKTIQSAIDDVNAAGEGIIYVREGTYVEDLTFYADITLIGASKRACTIQGIHTPPITAGSVELFHFNLQSGTHIFSSAAVGLTNFTLTDCYTECFNGYVFDLPNWTGLLGFTAFIEMTDCYSVGGAEGPLNSTGVVTFIARNCVLGISYENPLIMQAGEFLCSSSTVQCPQNFSGIVVVQFNNGSTIEQTITTEDTASIDIVNSSFSTGINTAITHNSTSEMLLSDVNIDTSNTYAIDGSGTINFGSVTFTDSKGIAPTITESLESVVKTGEIYAENIQDQIFTGFNEWDSAGSIYTVNGTNFTVDMAGNGYIKGKKVKWDGSQTVASLAAGATHLIYMDDTGTIGSTSSITRTIYETVIPLFEVLVDSDTPANVLVVKENHPYSAPTVLSNYLHDTVGVVISNITNGANIIAGANADEVAISGEDTLEDHGLETTIPDSAGASVTWNIFYTNGAGKWVLDDTTVTIPSEYNNAGTPTALGASKYGVFTLYASKDDIETTTPKYIAVMDDAEYNNITAADTAISNGTVSVPTAELENIELARLGYIIYSEASSTIVDFIIDKATIRASSTTSGTTTANLITTTTTNFDGILSASDTTVQAALETLDEFGKNLTQYYVVLGGGNGSPLDVVAGIGSAGQVLTSNGAGAEPTFQDAGGGGGGLTWTVTDTNASIVEGNGYIANKAGLLTMTLPATASVGDTFAITNINTAVGWRIAQNADGYIRFGNTLTTTGVGGYLEATALGDTVECICIVEDDGWLVISSIGNITIV